MEGLQMIGLSKHMTDEQDLKISNNFTIPSRSTVNYRVNRIKIAFLQHIRVNTFWANKLILCEYMNLANLTLQIYFTNTFLGGQFYMLGVNFIKDDFTGIMDTLDLVFPKVTKCHFYKYGASGTIQKFDALCVMALNVINEKIFVFLWFWYIVLMVITLLAIFWRILTIFLHSR